MTWGDQASVSKARSFIFNRGFYTKLHIEDNRGCEIMQSQQSLILIKTRVSFLQIYCIQMVSVIYIIFWPEGLLAFYDSGQSFVNRKTYFLYE